jgi:hypothetical protein
MVGDRVVVGRAYTRAKIGLPTVVDLIPTLVWERMPSK